MVMHTLDAFAEVSRIDQTLVVVSPDVSPGTVVQALAADDARVPATQRFLTGGDLTVRGYDVRGIGVPQPDGSVLPGRYLGVASLEWQRPIWGDGVSRSPFEHVLFVDGGAVANRVSELDFLWGVGTGLRYNSPVGPLQVDIAYGLETRRLRLHLNVGFVF